MCLAAHLITIAMRWPLPVTGSQELEGKALGLAKHPQVCGLKVVLT